MLPLYRNGQAGRIAAFAASLLVLSGCVSVAPIEPIKNPPTLFRSDNTVEVEFLSPAIVGIRCGERGTAFYGVPVFHAMACGNGRLITMPDPCETFTGGTYAALLCDLSRQPAAEPLPAPEWQALLQPASFKAPARPSPAPLKPRGRSSVKAEFVHPSAVQQRCNTRGLGVVTSEDGAFSSCGDGERITVPNPCMILTGGWYPRTLCHEMAHANGWAMNHPGGSFLSDARAGVDPNDVPPPRALLAALPKSGALRPASESPAYLAYAAAKDLKAAPSAALAQPAVFVALADASPGASPAISPDFRPAAWPASPLGRAAGFIAALKALQVAVPDFLEDAKVFAGDLPGGAAPGARLRPAFDLMAAARLYEASLGAAKAPGGPASLQPAALAYTDAAGLPAPDAQADAGSPGRAAPAVFAALDPGLPGLGPYPDAPQPDEGMAIRQLAEAAARPEPPVAPGAVAAGLELRGRSAAQDAVSGAASEDAPAAPLPGSPSAKPDLLWPPRDKPGVPAAAAGV